MKRKRSRYRLPDWLPTKHAKSSRLAKKSGNQESKKHACFFGLFPGFLASRFVFLICFLSKYFSDLSAVKTWSRLVSSFRANGGGVFRRCGGGLWVRYGKNLHPWSQIRCPA